MVERRSIPTWPNTYEPPTDWMPETWTGVSYFPAKLSIAQKYSCRSRPVTSVKVLLKV
jgi:hypothetical protein